MFKVPGRRYYPQFLLTIQAASIAVAGATTPLIAGAEVAIGGEITLGEAVEHALQQNPGLQALDAEHAALAEKPSQAGALPDPVVSLNLMSLPTDTFDFDQEPMTQLQIGVSQAIPFPGKRKLRRDVAEFEARAGAARAAEQRDALIGAVRRTWWRVFETDRALAIVEQNQALMRDFIEVAETKYTVGRGLQQDVLLAQLELSRLLDRHTRLVGSRRVAASQLNALLGRPAEYAVRLPTGPPNTTLPDLPSVAELVEHAEDYRDLLDAHREMVAAASARLAAAERDRFPDFRLGAGYGLRQGYDPFRRKDRPDFLSIMFSVTVPLHFRSKQGKAIDQRAFEHTQQRHSLENVVRVVGGEISSARAAYESAREQVALLETAIIPQARQTVASMLAGYQVSEVDFLNVVNGQLALYNAQIDYWRALSQAKRSLAQVAATSGMEVLYE